MEEFLKVLEELYSIQGNSETDEDDGREYFTGCDIVEKAAELCVENLVTEDGDCDWDNIRILRNNGYRVWAGEKDSFGWLSGCVQKQGDRRILTYW